MPAITPEIVESFIGLAKAAARVADARATELDQLRKKASELESENRGLKQANQLSMKQASVYAEFLEREQLLPEGVSVEKAAAAIQRNPAGLIGNLLKVIAPAGFDGQPVKTANTTSGSPDLIDHDGWLEALTV